MENKFHLSQLAKKGEAAEKNSHLVQIIFIVSSGILSSSVLATALKAWLDNRKTKLTIQVEGDRKKLEYEGHHLSQDAAAIQAVLASMEEQPRLADAVKIVTVEIPADAQKESYELESHERQGNVAVEGREQVAALPERASFKQFLPHWLHR